VYLFTTATEIAKVSPAMTNMWSSYKENRHAMIYLTKFNEADIWDPTPLDGTMESSQDGRYGHCPLVGI